MSVINQMLKDLDERQSEHQQGQANQILMKKPSTPWKIITFIVIIVIALNIAGIFIWQLYSENKTLKTINESSYDQKQQGKSMAYHASIEQGWHGANGGTSTHHLSTTS